MSECDILLESMIKVEEEELMQPDSMGPKLELEESVEEDGLDRYAPKRMRTSNFTLEDVFRLIDVATKFRRIIENKRTDATTSNDKKNAWEKIAALYNSQAMAYRSEHQLRQKFDNLKKDARKYAARKKQQQQLHHTSVGSPNFKMNIALERVLDIIKVSSQDNESPIDNNSFTFVEVSTGSENGNEKTVDGCASVVHPVTLALPPDKTPPLPRYIGVSWKEYTRNILSRPLHPALRRQLSKTSALSSLLSKGSALNTELTKTGALNSQFSKSSSLNTQLSETSALTTLLSKIGALNTQLSKAGALNMQLSESGALNTQLSETSALNTQLPETSTLNTQLSKSCALNTPESKIGALNTQLSKAGALSTQLSKSGAMNTQLSEMGTLNTQLSETGVLNAQLSETAALNTQLSETGALNTQLSETGALNTQLSETGALNTQLSESGAMNTQLSETGEMNTLLSESSAVNTQLSKPVAVADSDSNDNCGINVQNNCLAFTQQSRETDEMTSPPLASSRVCRKKNPLLSASGRTLEPWVRSKTLLTREKLNHCKRKNEIELQNCCDLHSLQMKAEEMKIEYWRMKMEEENERRQRRDENHKREEELHQLRRENLLLDLQIKQETLKKLTNS